MVPQPLHVVLWTRAVIFTLGIPSLLRQESSLTCFVNYPKWEVSDFREKMKFLLWDIVSVLPPQARLFLPPQAVRGYHSIPKILA